MGLCIRQGSGGVCPSGRPANPIWSGHAE
jgi:hypothetical protein